MNKNYIEIDELFKEKDGEFYLNRKYLNDVTVSMIEPSKTLTQLQRKYRIIGIRKAVIYSLVIALSILSFPAILLLMVFVVTTEIFRK